MIKVRLAGVNASTKNLLSFSNNGEIYVIPLIEVTSINLRNTFTLHVEVSTKYESYIINGEKKELRELFEKLKTFLSDFFSQGA